MKFWVLVFARWPKRWAAHDACRLGKSRIHLLRRPQVRIEALGQPQRQRARHPRVHPHLHDGASSCDDLGLVPPHLSPRSSRQAVASHAPLTSGATTGRRNHEVCSTRLQCEQCGGAVFVDVCDVRSLSRKQRVLVTATTRSALLSSTA